MGQAKLKSGTEATMWWEKKAFRRGLKKGHFSVIFQGDKLKGQFIFQKLKRDPEDHNWILMKKRDKDQGSNRSKMPDAIEPMLAHLVREPFDSEDWLFEVKWDGFRALAFINKGKVKLKSRSGQLLNQKFAPVVHDLEKIEESAILDGELVVLDKRGKPDFQAMQNYQKSGKGDLVYEVFDLLYLQGQDLRELPLIERKERLEQFLKESDLPGVRYSSHLVARGVDFFKEASRAHLEGIMGKKISSSYQMRRSRDWVKIKAVERQEMVIGGFTAPKGSREQFGALLVGIYDDQGKLHYAGKVGGGFTQELLKEVYKKLKPLVQKSSPFSGSVPVKGELVWVKPKLIAELSFAEWTQEKIMRQPIFHGLREDKNPEKRSARES